MGQVGRDSSLEDPVVTDPNLVADRARAVSLRPTAARGREIGRSVVVIGAIFLIAMSSFGYLQVRMLRSMDARMNLKIEQLQSSFVEARGAIKSLQSRSDRFADWMPRDLPGMLDEAARSVVTIEVGYAVGSGFAVETADLPEGYSTAILTNEHVVHAARLAPRPAVFVVRGTGRLLARLGPGSSTDDVAVVYVREFLPTLPVNSRWEHQLQVGDAVFALGSPYLLQGTATAGIVSRIEPDVIQTDAAVNPGSSGGPLLSAEGRVVGVVNSGVLRGDSLGFAVPIENACDRRLLLCPLPVSADGSIP